MKKITCTFRSGILSLVLAAAMLLAALTACSGTTAREANGSVSLPPEAESSAAADASLDPADGSGDPAEGSGDQSVPPAVEADSDEPYPNLYARQEEKTDDNTQKIIYLTFDDGPSENTEKILDTLDRYGIKATFFVTGQYGTKEERETRYQKILDSGNVIGLHTYSHNYDKIYASTDAFLKDLNKIYTEVYEATGFRASLIRFPGGSVSQHNQHICKELIQEIEGRGFTYHDWAVSCGDAEGKQLSASTIAEETVKACADRTKSVVLFHDTPSQGETVKALPSLIESLMSKGYEFRALDPSVKPFHFVIE